MKPQPITTFTKTLGTLLAALFLLNLFAISPVHASQGITELQSPDRVWAGESFPVTIRAQYDFAELGDVKIWARYVTPQTIKMWQFQVRPQNWSAGKVRQTGISN